MAPPRPTAGKFLLNEALSALKKYMLMMELGWWGGGDHDSKVNVRNKIYICSKIQALTT